MKHAATDGTGVPKDRVPWGAMADARVPTSSRTLQRGAPGWLAVLVAGACQPTSDRYADLDRPEPLPPVVETRATESEEGAVRQHGDPAECGRGTGRTPEGTCVYLRTRDLPHGQQVQIPRGTYVVGMPPRSYDAAPALERPAVRWPGQPPRTVEAPGFWIDLHEVTRGAYASCVESGACTPARCPKGAPDPTADYSMEVARRLPQTCVTHEQAAAFCAYAGGRLPTADEYEIAARGVDARPYPWGTKFMDEVPRRLVPVGAFRPDTSYFGILGMGTNGWEWTADRYDDPDARLRFYLSGDFRRADGPVARARAEFELRVACGDPPSPGCRATEATRARFVIKGTLVGEHYAARGRAGPEAPTEELEGWPFRAEDPMIGFRCAADPQPDEVVLEVPEAAVSVPILRTEGDLEIFGGVAEAVDRREAKALCAALSVRDEATETVHTGFRLPTRAEVRSIATVFRGPGPFWAKDGAVGQHDPRTPAAVSGADAPWMDLDLPDSTPLWARCVRDLRK
ncbi:MAG: formylglycine-generating enzyme family protein [Deltaproteobacteria bacterium]|nr:MAG: formylglycine-generating enzyme family protein [Deltaproteobacteria bacterium]